MAKKKMELKAEFVEGAVLPLSNVKVKWAALQEPDTKFEPCWKIDIIITEEQANNLKAVGFKCRQDSDGDWILRAKKKVRTKSGKAQRAPLVVGRDGRTPITDNVGNGSLCNVNVYAKYVEVAGVTHLPCYLNEVQVIDLVPYSGSTGFKPIPEETVPF
jgi:hypothetical protein